jgi:hypothetical protein
LVAVFTSLESCQTYEIAKDREKHHLRLRSRIGKCLHIYAYLVDAVLGWVCARIQTWFPFNIQICVNGRDRLARQLDKAGIGYRRCDNSFTSIDDMPKAQKLLDRQLNTDWRWELDRLARVLNPTHAEIFGNFNAKYYWSLFQGEWATDLLFRDPKDLHELMPRILRYGVLSFTSRDVIKVLSGKKPNGNYLGELITDFKDRASGVRLKHWMDRNSIKTYDKSGSVLRIETTINDPSAFKIWRPAEGKKKPGWRPCRKGIADLYALTALTRLTHAANERYAEALGQADSTVPLGDLVSSLANPVNYRGHRIRGLRAWSSNDLTLIKNICRGDFLAADLRNRDLQALMFPLKDPSPDQVRRRSAKVGRLLRLLRAHKLIVSFRQACVTPPPERR